MVRGGPPLIRGLALSYEIVTLFQKGHEFREARADTCGAIVKIGYCL
jgi:hypothetical protein